MSFGTIIKKLCRKCDMTQEELAEAFNISPQAVSRWKNDVAIKVLDKHLDMKTKHDYIQQIRDSFNDACKAVYVLKYKK